MFVFGHVGLTWGGALLLAGLPRRLLPSRSEPGATVRPARVAGRISSVAIDYRFVILGSMLPDLVDKPLGVFILGDELGNGRMFGHSLAFIVLLLLAALAFRGRAGLSLSLAALGSAVHVALDRLWENTETLLWPLSGWRPERQDVDGWVEQMVEQLFSDPYTYVSEVVGAVVVVALLAYLVMRRGLWEFALTGRMDRGSGAPPAPRLAARQERPQQLKGGKRAAER